MINNYQPQVGDRVSILATVVEAPEWDLPSIAIDGLDKDVFHEVFSSRLTLVERPEPKITVELTKDQARCLATYGEYGASTTTRNAAAIIRKALNERS